MYLFAFHNIDIFNHKLYIILHYYIKTTKLKRHTLTVIFLIIMIY